MVKSQDPDLVGEIQDSQMRALLINFIVTIASAFFYYISTIITNKHHFLLTSIETVRLSP